MATINTYTQGGVQVIEVNTAIRGAKGDKGDPGDPYPSAAAEAAVEASRVAAEAAASNSLTYSQNSLASSNTSTTQAGIATTQAGIATTQAGIATDKSTLATTQADIATTKAGEALTSANTSTTQAGISTTQATLATTQAGIATDKATLASSKADIATTQAGISTTKAGESNASAILSHDYSVSSQTSSENSLSSSVIATTQAGIATTQAGIASDKATLATTQAGIASTQAGIATDKATLANNAEVVSTTQAGIATDKAILATTQAGIATTQAGISTAASIVATEQSLSAQNSADDALLSADISATKADIATTKAGEALTSANLSYDYSVSASNSSGIATTQAGIATTQAGISTTKAGEALSSAILASSKADIATAQANSATNSAGVAATQANIALSQTSLSQTSSDAAIAASIIATTKAGEAIAASDNVTTQANIATTQAGIATDKATLATTKADIATAKADIATTKASEAVSSANIATTKAGEVVSYADIATTQAGISTTKASEASGYTSLTAADKVQTGLDRIQTGLDRISTSDSAASAAANELLSQKYAINPVDTVVIDGGTDYSSLHWATKSAESQGIAGSFATSANDAKVAAQAAANNAVTVVTGGTASITPAAGKIPIADSTGKIDVAWLDLLPTSSNAALHRSPNAVTAMFIYDTSKDSDGGAWVEKCQHLSWYNEALNGKWLGRLVSEAAARAVSGAITGDYFQLAGDGKFYKLNAVSGITEVFRGNKAKWPRLSAIVCESSGVSYANVAIYDLTESGCPMFMAFSGVSGGIASGNMLPRYYAFGGALGYTCCAAVNGLLLFGSDTIGFAVVRLLEDSATLAGGDVLRYAGNISQRNGSKGYKSVVANSMDRITHRGGWCNSIAVCLPSSSPFNPVTGLPIPLIATAGSLGVSVFYPNSWSAYSSSPANYHRVTLTPRLLSACVSTDGNWYSATSPEKLPSNFALSSNTASDALDFNQGNTTGLKSISQSALVRSSGALLQLMRSFDSSPSMGVSATVAPTYATGYMVGDIRRCYLAGTVAGAVSNPTTLPDRSYKAATATVYGSLTATPVA